MLRYLAERLVSEEPPQAVLSMQVPHVLSAPLKTSLMVRLSPALVHHSVYLLHAVIWTALQASLTAKVVCQ